MPVESSEKKVVDFVKGLTGGRPVDCMSFRGVGLQQALEMIQKSGEAMNSNNPWSLSTNRRDSLRKRLGFWKAIGCNNLILSFLAYGIPLHMSHEPPRSVYSNHVSYNQHIEFADKEVEKHLKDGSFVEVSEAYVKIVNPLLIEPKGQDDFRMCMDGRYVNMRLAYIQFILESLEHDLPDIVKKFDLLFTADVSKAYFAVPMHESAWPYLCFKHRGRYYACTILMFGLSLAPVVFHKIMKEVVKFMRVLGIKVITYIDDFLWAEDARRANLLVSFVKAFLVLLGWELSAKTNWTPAMITKFLGYIIDSEKFQFGVPQEKLSRVSKIVEMMRETLSRGEAIEKHDLQVLAGTLISFRLAIPSVRLWTRGLYAAIEGNQAKELLEEDLLYWSSQLKANPVAPIRLDPSTVKLFSDASVVGWGGYCKGERASGLLPADAIGQSSTLRELMALWLCLSAFQVSLKGLNVECCMDSTAACRVMSNGGSSKPYLTYIAKQIQSMSDLNMIKLQFRWLPREENKEADALSRLSRYSWKLTDNVKHFLEQSFGPLMESLEFLSQKQLRLVNVEFIKIAEALQICQERHLDVLLVYPGWPSQSWWVRVQAEAIVTVELPSEKIAFVADHKSIGASVRPWRYFVSRLSF
jgi:hypothetical protein